MPLSNGWISTDNAGALEALEGSKAELHYFLRVPHRTLILRFLNESDISGEWYLICSGCQTLELRPDWVVKEFHYTRLGEDDIVLEDIDNGVEIRCYAARLLDHATYVKWLGRADWMAALAAPEAKTMLVESATWLRDGF